MQFCADVAPCVGLAERPLLQTGKSVSALMLSFKGRESCDLRGIVKLSSTPVGTSCCGGWPAAAGAAGRSLAELGAGWSPLLEEQHYVYCNRLFLCMMLVSQSF